MRQGKIRTGLSGSWRAVAAAVVVAGGVLVGCGTEPDVEPTPTVEPTTATPEPEPEPTEEAPEEPEAPLPRTGTPDEYDAEDAGEFFLRLYEYTLITGDTAQWEERSLPGCQYCAQVSEHVAEMMAEQSQMVGLEFTLERPQFVAFDEVLRMFAVQVPYAQSAAEVVAPDGTVVKSYSGGSGFLLLELGYQPSTGWLLRTGNDLDESFL